MPEELTVSHSLSPKSVRYQGPTPPPSFGAALSPNTPQADESSESLFDGAQLELFQNRMSSLRILVFTMTTNRVHQAR